MARKPKALRYLVTGPGLGLHSPYGDFIEEPSYDNVGQALSRSITAAERWSPVEGTWYVRDSILGDVLGHSEVVIDGGTVRTVTVLNAKGRKAVGK
jgi:hypothetical protein